jgi:hypothetical protein
MMDHWNTGPDQIAFENKIQNNRYNSLTLQMGLSSKANMIKSLEITIYK